MSIGGISENILDHSLSLKSAPIGPGIIETLQAQLKQREGELFQLKAERNTNQQQREKLAAEVVRLSALADKVDELTQNNQVYYSLSFPSTPTLAGILYFCVLLNSHSMDAHFIDKTIRKKRKIFICNNIIIMKNLIIFISMLSNVCKFKIGLQKQKFCQTLKF